MNYEYIYNINIDPSQEKIEVVERKGIGHPDSVADIIAESFSNKYSKYCLEHFGEVLNHWFDKVTISGGEAELSPGFLKVLKKPKIYLFGKVTHVINNNIPLDLMFKETVNDVFSKIFGIEKSLLPDTFIDVNSGVGADHIKDFYTYNNLKKNTELFSNDTVFCNGYFNYSKLENYVIDLENYVNSADFKKKFPQTGFDVKILGVRTSNSVVATVCVPFISKKVNSWEDYKKQKLIIHDDLNKFSKPYKWDLLDIQLNTKDSDRMGYLTVFGTALDKGDFGAVGRGNRYSGIISLNRGETQEAYHGKNPMIHSGKLYTIIAHRIARRIYAKTLSNVNVLISTNNGTPLLSPENVCISFSKDMQIDLLSHNFKEIIDSEIQNIPKLSMDVISLNPVSEFKNRSILDKEI
jgi:S-adenosylmethionine synthetase